MEDFLQPMDLTVENRESDQDDSFLIFTHNQRTRIFVLILFSAFLVFFVFLSKAFRVKVVEIKSLPGIFQADGGGVTQAFLLGGIIWILAFLLLLYLIAAVIDVWGLQVHLGQSRILVTNTLSGNFMASLFGVGILNMDDIREVKGRAFHTEIKGVTGRIRFTPVDRLDLLIEKLYEYAPEAKFDV